MSRYGTRDHHSSSRQKSGKNPIVIGAILLLLIAVFGGAIFSTVGACSQPEKEPLTVGFNTPFPPFEDRLGNKVVGFDVDMSKLIADKLGRTLIIKDISEFDAMFPTIQAGNIDMIASAITIRSDREEVVDFSDPYFDASQAVLIVDGSSITFTGDPNDLQGLAIGYQEGTTSQFWLEDNVLGTVEIGEQTPFGDITFGLQLLQRGAVDVIIVDEPAAQAFAKSLPDLKVAGTIDTGEEYGFVVAEGDPQGLLPTINDLIAEMKESGEYDKLIVKWFGGEE